MTGPYNDSPYQQQSQLLDSRYLKNFKTDLTDVYDFKTKQTIVTYVYCFVWPPSK